MNFDVARAVAIRFETRCRQYQNIAEDHAHDIPWAVPLDYRRDLVADVDILLPVTAPSCPHTAFLPPVRINAHC